MIPHGHSTRILHAHLSQSSLAPHADACAKRGIAVGPHRCDRQCTASTLPVLPCDQRRPGYCPTSAFETGLGTSRQSPLSRKLSVWVAANLFQLIYEHSAPTPCEQSTSATTRATLMVCSHGLRADRVRLRGWSGLCEIIILQLAREGVIDPQRLLSTTSDGACCTTSESVRFRSAFSELL